MSAAPGAALSDTCPAGGGMAARIRGHDWAATPLGPLPSWPSTLRSALDLCLSAAFPTAVYWGPDLRLFYNDAWAPIPAERHPWALGRPAVEVWSDIWEVVGPQFRHVLETGEGFSTFEQMLPIRRGGRVQETFWNYSLTPIRGEDGTVTGVLNQGHEITDQVHATRRQAFRLDLERRLRDIGEPDDVIATAQALLGEHLGANRVGYGEVDAGALRYFTTTNNWTDGTVPPRHGTHDLEAFGPEILGALRRGETLVIDDVRADPRTAMPRAVAAFAAIETASVVTSTLLKNGRMQAALYVHAREPRSWARGDVALVEEVAERIWSAVERANAEAALRTSEERYRSLVEATAAIVWDAPASGAFEEPQPHWSAFTGQSWDELKGHGFLDAIHPEDRDRVADLWARAVETRSPYEAEYRLRRRDGAYRHMLARAVPIPDKSGAVGSWIGSHTDVHDLRVAEAELRRLNETLETQVDNRTAELLKAEEALRQAQKMEAIGQLTGGVAHDFNNLLTVVTGSLDIARRSLAAGDEARTQRLIDNALKGAQRAAALTQRLLAFSRRQPLAPRAVDVNELVTSMGADLLARTLGEAIHLETDAALDLWPAVADPNQLENAILNLAVNGRDAMAERAEARLTIRTANREIDAGIAAAAGIAPGRYVEIAVSDTGAGIPPEAMTRIFEPFYTTKEQGKGTGLGLPTVFGFMKQSGGTVLIDSVVGSGTTVKLLLPVAETKPAAVPVARQGLAQGVAEDVRRADGGPLTVLVVEDQEAVGDLAEAVLVDAGYRVLRAPDGPRALAILADPAGAEVGLLFSDVVMPGGMSGLDLAREVGRRRPDLPVLLTTGYAHASLGLHGDASRGAEYPVLDKPYRRYDLLAKVRDVLGDQAAPARSWRSTG
ncbi:GAF domain-containing hybrid sensor histidine kinase/response regulator [Salinarimonas soli]|uniref:histidine kinase n=1 Tax=Salinarimonas soli TaxID=1638099 RepID=A0A5B2VC41_9HYPH|nr:PAS domain S-box protein [Salinarimonas soli]KAA2236691.1 PAS domain S-box protein [Salinarimonas soli]